MWIRPILGMLLYVVTTYIYLLRVCLTFILCSISNSLVLIECLFTYVQVYSTYLYLPQAQFSNFLSKFFSGTNYFERPAIRSNMYYMWCSSSVKSNLSLVNDQFHLAPILSVHMSFFCRFPLILMCVYVSGVRRCIGGRTQLGWGCW